MPENKAANAAFNKTIGHSVGSNFFPAKDSPQADKQLAPLINGDFTGTTKEILRWAACKWGISQAVVFAQAAAASWWEQGTLGSWGTNPNACPPGHGLGEDGRPGLCPQRYGILQDRYQLVKGGWPDIDDSTAMNLDAAYAIWRSCYNGYEPWLNNLPHGRAYQKGDLWGCIGRWATGRWYEPAALKYVARVQQYLRERIWTKPYFRQPDPVNTPNLAVPSNLRLRRLL